MARVVSAAGERMATVSKIRIPKPEEIRLSPQLQRGLADFQRVMREAGKVIEARGAEVIRELNAALRDARR